MTSALTRAASKTARTPADAAAIALARAYTRAIDGDPRTVERLGPGLLAVLVQLGMTPKARGGVIRPDPVATGPDRRALDELRARRFTRAARADRDTL